MLVASAVLIGTAATALVTRFFCIEGAAVGRLIILFSFSVGAYILCRKQGLDIAPW